MSRGRRERMLAPMSESHVVIGIDLDPSTDAFAGWIRRADGSTRQFFGWVGLVAALDELLDDQPSQGGPA